MRPIAALLLPALLCGAEPEEILKSLEFAIDLPRTPLTVDTVNTAEFSIRLTNKSEKQLIVHPYFTLRLLDAQGNAVKPKRWLGRWGRRKPGCLLVQVPFETVEPGKTWSVKGSLERYSRDPMAIIGWEVQEPGDYTLEATYEFDRAAFRKRCREPDCAGHDDAAKAWNLALELKHTFRVAMKVG